MRIYGELFLTFSVCLLFTACPSTTQILQKSKQEMVTLSLQKLSCEECGERVVRVLKQQKGIAEVQFDKHTVELKVTYHKQDMSKARLIQIIQSMEFVALPCAGKGAYLPAPKFDANMDVKLISKQGEDIELKNHLALGKITVFDFYAVWCGPCKDVDHSLYRLLQKSSHIAVRKINVVDWQKPVVKRYMTGISQLPYLIIFDQKGRKVKELVGGKTAVLEQTVRSLLGVEP